MQHADQTADTTHLADSHPLAAITTNPSDRDQTETLNTWQRTTGQLTATAWADRTGLLHGNPRCINSHLDVTHGTLIELARKPLCNNPHCVNTETLTNSRYANHPHAASQTHLLETHIHTLHETVQARPYLVLSEGKLLQQRLTHPAYAHTNNKPEIGILKQKLQRVIDQAAAHLNQHDIQEQALARAIHVYLTQLDLGPLEDLRHLANDLPQTERTRLGNLAKKYNIENQHEIDQLLATLESTHYLQHILRHSAHTAPGTVCTVDDRPRARHTTPSHPVPLPLTWHRRAQEAAQRLPQWWDSQTRNLTNTTDLAIAYLPEAHIRRIDNYPWEAHRQHPESPILVLPYAAGRLAETTHNAPIAVTETHPKPEVLETLQVLICDNPKPPRRGDMESYLRTAQLLTTNPHPAGTAH